MSRKSNEEFREVRIKELDIDLIPPCIEKFNDNKEDGGKIVVIGKPGCFAKGTKILMFDSKVKNVEDVVINDLVMGDDNTQRTVQSLARNSDVMYRVQQSTGKTYVVNQHHILVLQRGGEVLKIRLIDYIKLDASQQQEYRGIVKNINSILTITKIGIDQYYGFELDGNHMFQLEDGTIVHNTGKCLAGDVMVLMSNGKLKCAKDIVVGDSLMGDDYKKRTVLSITSGQDKMYRVDQTIGDSYTVNEPHILCLKTTQGELEIEVGEYLKKSAKIGPTRGFKSLPIDDPHGRLGDLKVENPGEKHLEKAAFDFTHGLATGLAIDLKFFPNVQIRWKLLLNIIAAGNASYDSDYQGFIFDGVLNYIELKQLANSLGIQTRLMDGYAVVKLSRHDLTSRNPPKIETETEIKITSVGKGTYYGFEIDGNKRFLLGDFTVTHNTTLIKSILYEKSFMFPVAQITSGTEDSNHSYGEFVDSSFIFNKLDLDQYREFIKRQKIAKKYLPNPWSVQLWDDCTEDTRLFNDPLIHATYKNGRHWRMLHILSLQYCMDIKPVIRTNVDGTFILRESLRRNRESLWKNYVACIPDFDDFCDVLDQLTNDYTALYVHNRSKSNKIEDCLFYYNALERPKPPADWKFGAQEVHDFHDARFNFNYEDPIVV